MAVKLRLQRKGRKKSPFYHIVAADNRAPRDGRFIEKLGTYNPLTVPATIVLNNERTYDWLMKGAQPTDTVRAILRFKGVLYQKHLAQGVKKGALTEEQAEAKLTAWIEEKENRVAQRREETAEKQRQFLAAVDGAPRPKAKKEEAPVVEEAPAAEATEEAIEATTAVADAPAETPAVEEVKAETTEEAPAAEEVKAEATEEAPAAEEVKAEAIEEAPAAEEVKAEATEEAPAAEEVKAEATEDATAAEEEKKED